MSACAACLAPVSCSVKQKETVRSLMNFFHTCGVRTPTNTTQPAIKAAPTLRGPLALRLGPAWGGREGSPAKPGGRIRSVCCTVGRLCLMPHSASLEATQACMCQRQPGHRHLCAGWRPSLGSLSLLVDRMVLAVPAAGSHIISPWVRTGLARPQWRAAILLESVPRGVRQVGS